MPKRVSQFRSTHWKPYVRQALPGDSFYKSSLWKGLRKQALERDHYQCVVPTCTTPLRGRGGRLIVHHIKERTLGGVDHISNLRTQCPTCDNRIHGHRGSE